MNCPSSTRIVILLRKSFFIAATIFLTLLGFAPLMQLLLPIVATVMPPYACDIAMSENEIRKLIVEAINKRDIHTYFSKNVTSLNSDDGIWRIVAHSREEIGDDAYGFMKYEVSLKHESQEIISYVGSCANIDRIYNQTETNMQIDLLKN